MKLSRHGYGIQLFGNDANGAYKGKYAGQWNRDKKHGEGHCDYADESIYKGNYKEDKFDGYGFYRFPRQVDKNSY